MNNLDKEQLKSLLKSRVKAAEDELKRLLIACEVLNEMEMVVESPAVILGRRGGKKGGLARAKSLTPERRSEISRDAANKRWGNNETRKTD